MTYLWLVRHGAHDYLGKCLVGRMPGVMLNEEGERQSMTVAAALGVLPLSAIYSSPLERARQTAAPTAAWHGAAPLLQSGLHEVDFGIWTGQTFQELEGDARWGYWNSHRDLAQIPGGENMRDISTRVTRCLQGLAEIHRGRHVAAFSHGDVIRAALACCGGIPMREIHRIHFEPADVALLTASAAGLRVFEVVPHGQLASNAQALADAWWRARRAGEVAALA